MNQKKGLGRSAWALTAVVACSLVLSCGTGCKKGAGAAAGAAATAAPYVKTVTITPETIVLNTDLPGRTSPFRIAEIRPQVSGVILKRHFEEGSDVKAGDSLYQIDPAPYEAALNSAKAGLARSEASLPAAQLRMDRYKQALAEKAVSQQDYDDAESAVRQIQADIEYYKAQVATAEINVQYSKVISPIDGRIGTSVVTDGAVVTAYNAAPLATVQQLDPIYVDVPQSTSDMLRLKSLLKEGLLEHDAETINKVSIILDDGSVYEHQGTFQFRDITVDHTTSTITLRIIVPNPDGELLPGMYVRAIVEEGTNKKAYLLPQEAVMRDRKGTPYLWVVGADKKVFREDLVMDRAVGNRWLVKSGFKGDEHVVIEGLQSIRMPGVEVNEDFAGDVSEWKAKAAAAAAAEEEVQKREAAEELKQVTTDTKEKSEE